MSERGDEGRRPLLTRKRLAILFYLAGFSLFAVEAAILFRGGRVSVILLTAAALFLVAGWMGRRLGRTLKMPNVEEENGESQDIP